MDNSDVTSPSQIYKKFPEDNKVSIKRYYYDHIKLHSSDITVEITNIDTIREMEISINKIKDPVKRCENLSRLHAMKLRPIVNKNKKSIKEILDGV
ncbi:MAG: hypothetical protein ACXACY_28980 [Candidatus Hodarchaeales archaeon]